MTIKDLAAKTGYAVGTVSRALNDQSNVSDKARRAILEAARESGFQLNVNAKQLKQAKSTNILVIVKGTRNEFFSAMVEHIQARVAQTRYQLVVDYMDEDQNEVLRALRLIQEKKPLGILFLGGNNCNFARGFDAIDIPCVLVSSDASMLPFSNLSSITTDDRAAARAGIEALIDFGHRRIAVIGGDNAISDTSRLRYEGCLEAFQERGVPFNPIRDYQGVRYSYQGGYEATQAILERTTGITAIFAASDVMAIGAIRALGERGLSVPGDVSVLSVDGLALGGYLVPRLATIVQSAQGLGQRAVEILLASIEEEAPARHETVPFTLAMRESVRAV